MTRSRNRMIAVLALTFGSFGLASATWAFLTTTGSGTAAASTSTLGPPTDVVATASGGSVSLAWAAAAAPNGGAVDGYYVVRSAGSASGRCTSSPSSLLPATPTSCTDSGVPSGAFTYNVVAVFRSWTAGASSNSVVVTAVDHFQVTAPASVTVGSPFSVTVTAQDAANATATTYSGTKAMVWSGAAPAPNGSLPSYPSSVTFVDGVGTASVTLVKAESVTLTVAQGAITGTSAALEVSPGAATQFTVSVATPQTAGIAFSPTITAQDLYRNAATAYTGSKTINFTGPRTSPSGAAPTYPASVVFSSGAGSASVTLTRAETATITATQAGTTIAGASGGIVVNRGAAARLAWTGATVDGGTLSSPCLFTCTATSVNNKNLTGKVAVTDSLGNTVSDLGGGHTVTVSVPAGQNLGAFTSPTSGTSVSLTIASSGAAESPAFNFKAKNGSWTSETLTAGTGAGTPYTNTTAVLSK